jgi:hypothetical protein
MAVYCTKLGLEDGHSRLHHYPAPDPRQWLARNQDRDGSRHHRKDWLQFGWPFSRYERHQDAFYGLQPLASSFADETLFATTLRQRLPRIPQDATRFRVCSVRIVHVNQASLTPNRHLMIADRSRAVSIECAPHGFKVLQPDEHSVVS